ncbi:MAG: molybdenum cofactor guanylyltransferase [Candidatus Lokiarchaeota archaeon]|nr:molybdenum cofactor guanylyltransferase [Candidatus Lokiarchaeota archaeon]
MENPKYLAILILIGGKSTRFGTEKAAIEFFGKSLILHQIETLNKFDQDIFLVAHSEEQVFNYRKSIEFPKEITFIVDDREIFKHLKIFKPMLGIYSGLKELFRLNFEKVFLLSCDMPLIKPEIIELMIKESEGYDCCIPRWNNGFLEPFFAIYPVEKGYYKAREILNSENYGLYNFIDKNWKINYVSVEKSIQPLDKNLVNLININGPIDLAKLIKFYMQNSSS